MTHRFRTLSISILSTALAFALSTPAVATPEDTVAQILQITPGVSRDGLIHAANDWASENGTTSEEALRMALDQLLEEQNSNATAHTGSSGAKLNSSPLGAATGSTSTLPKSWYKGDVYYTPTGAPWAHVGIYGGTWWVVEASGPGYKSDWYRHASITIRSGAKQVYYHVPQATQDAAADYAYNNLRGYRYNLNFAFNKSKNPWMLNCSQLVWYAYKYGAGVDIDSNGGPGVYPHDIVEGPLAHTYANL